MLEIALLQELGKHMLDLIQRCIPVVLEKDGFCQDYLKRDEIVISQHSRSSVL